MSHQDPTQFPPEPALPEDQQDKRPNERDLAIYRLVRIQLHKQKTAALRFSLTPGRVSQIVKKVTRFMAKLFPGEDLNMRFAEAKRMRLLDFECHERRVEMYGLCQAAVEQSQEPLVDRQNTLEGEEGSQTLVKTVTKERGQAFCMGAVREMRLLNNEMQWGGGRRGAWRAASAT